MRRKSGAAGTRQAEPRTGRLDGARPPGRGGIARGLLGLAAALAPGCASPDAELHLAPLFSRHTLPGYDHAEAAGGLLEYGEKEGAVTWALRPLVWRRAVPEGRVEADFLYPLGTYQADPQRPRTFVRLFPLFWHLAETRPDGVEDIDWQALFPFFWGGSSSDGEENYFAFLPLFGKLENFLTYDEIHFVLFPLYMRSHKDERNSYHLLWPLFGWTDGSEQGWRVFPLYGRSEVPGKYKRSYVLWPLLHFSQNDLDKPHPRQGWLVVPLVGRITQDDYTATTVLWPIFGWSSRPSTEFTSWQVWPILKFESGGKDSERKIGRILPFWHHFEDEETEFTSWLWPIFWTRHDHFGGIDRRSFYALPFYVGSRTVREDGREERKQRLWPIVRVEESTDGSDRFALFSPAFDRIVDAEKLSRNLGFLFEIWAGRSSGHGGPRERRAFLNLYHSVEAAGHRRWSLSGLVGQWTEPGGATHTSLLFGLLRWRTGPDGGLESPAFPGPGWPDLHAEPLHAEERL